MADRDALEDSRAFAKACAMRKHSVSIAGHRTSVSLEAAFWEALKTIATARGMTVAGLIEQVDRRRSHNLSGALRVFVLETLRGD